MVLPHLRIQHYQYSPLQLAAAVVIAIPLLFAHISNTFGKKEEQDLSSSADIFAHQDYHDQIVDFEEFESTDETPNNSLPPAGKRQIAAEQAIQ